MPSKVPSSMNQPVSGSGHYKAAQQALPFAYSASDGSTRFWPDQASLAAGNNAEQRIAGEQWALDLLRYYRDYGHEPHARVLADVIRHSLEDGGVGGEHFTGLLRVLDAMLAFAARHTDLEAYAQALQTDHDRTLSAWAALAAGGGSAKPEAP